MIAKAISYDLQRTDRTEMAVIPEDCETQVSTAIARLLYTEAYNTQNAELANFVEMPELRTTDIPAVEPMVDSTMNLLTPTVSDSTPDLMSVVTVNVSYGVQVGTTYARTYTMKLYKKQGTTTTLAATSLVRLPSGALSGTATFRIRFSGLGQYSLFAKIYNSSDSLLDTSSSKSVTVEGDWFIDVDLKDRVQLGTLTLYDAVGTMKCSFPCLGKADSGDPWYYYYGDTPTGECTGILGGPESNTYSYGPYKCIKLTAVSGNIKTLNDLNEAHEHYRSGIWIHGGAPSDSGGLRPTNGCIRVSNTNQLLLQTQIEALIASYHDDKGDVTIRTDEDEVLPDWVLN